MTIDPAIYTTAPADGLPKELETYRLLDALGIPYQRISHEPAMTIADCTDVDRLLGVSMCKNLLLCDRRQTAFYLLLLPGEKTFRSSDFSRELGISRVSFAPGERMEELLNITPGSLSIMGLAYDTARRVRLCIDRETAGAAYIGCHPCVNTASMKLRTADVLEKFVPYTGHDVTLVTL